jgi:hypothetical protein
MKAPALILFVVTATAWADTINVDDVKAGTLPTHWLATQTGSGAAKWEVEKADDGRASQTFLSILA